MAGRVASDVRFRRIFDETYDPVLRYCLRRLPAADANDAAAEVFTVAWRRLDSLPDGEGTLPYLYGIARNVVRNVQRSTRRTVRLRAKLQSLPDEFHPPPERVIVRNEEDRILVEALATLSPDDQEILRLRTYEDLDSRRIAAVLGCSEPAARKRLSRAVARLRRALPNGGMHDDSRVIEKGGDG